MQNREKTGFNFKRVVMAAVVLPLLISYIYYLPPVFVKMLVLCIVNSFGAVSFYHHILALLISLPRTMLQRTVKLVIIWSKSVGKCPTVSEPKWNNLVHNEFIKKLRACIISGVFCGH